MIETVSKTPPWIAATGPEAAVAVCSQCSLVRNLSDLPFPRSCNEDEKRSAEDRVVTVLEAAGLLSSGRYHSFPAMEPREQCVLAERRLVPWDLVEASGPRGVYVAEDQTASIALNAADHVTITGNRPGLQLPEAFNQITLLDDTLADTLEYGFDRRFGYLTASLRHVGTGMKASVVLHLPALAMTGRLDQAAQTVRQRRQVLYGFRTSTGRATGARPRRPLGPLAETDKAPGREVWESCGGDALYYDLGETLYGDANETLGDLYILSNQASLGMPEEEILFHMRHVAHELIEQEKVARAALLATESRRIEDRVARALGIARSARLLGFAEALSILSSIRLGADTELARNYGLPRLNELLFAAQRAHLCARTEQDCNEWTLTVQRADLFRARFGPDRKG